MRKFEKEFRLKHSETIGEKDKDFDDDSYRIFLENKISNLVEARVKPATEKEKLLDNILYEISAIMMNSYMIRSRPFGAFEGEKIMEQLNRWSSV